MAEMKEEEVHATPEIDLTNYIRNKIPYPPEQAKRIKYFYSKREHNRKLYKPNKTGDLGFYSQAGELKETIHLLTYVPHAPEIKERMEQERLDAIAFASKKYDEAILNLRIAMAKYKINGMRSEVLLAQQHVAEADAVLSNVRYRTINIQTINNPETRDIFFDQAKEKRKLISANEKDPYKKKLFRLITLEHPLYSFYGKYVESSPDTETGQDIDSELNRNVTSVFDSRRRLKDGRMARIFFDNESNVNSNTFLSPFWPVDFTLDDVLYSTALQAFEAERARMGGQEALRASILRTRSPRSIRYLTSNFKTPPKDAKALWLRIFNALYQQHPTLLEQLLSTGTDALVFADIRQGPSGTGFDQQSRDILDPSRWTGENALGVALETLRYQLREGSVKESVRSNNLKESTITKEEQDKAKLGAIIQEKKKFQIKKPQGAPAPGGV
jgi:predicted NAD-dependent protein-ADP-ribosyltransferase YbiA (DUF1768 family)